MMHRETPASCRLLLRKTFDAFEPGGLAIVSDVFFDDDSKRTPPFTVSFALNMMLTSDEGSAHANTEMARLDGRHRVSPYRDQETPAAERAQAGFGDTAVNAMPGFSPRTVASPTAQTPRPPMWLIAATGVLAVIILALAVAETNLRRTT